MSTSLDPVKAAFCGLFVAAAYNMYAVNNNDLRPAPGNYIPAGWELSAWIIMSDFLLLTTVPKFYGIVVHEIADPDNRIIAIRGTEGIVEWLDDAASIVMVPFRQVPSAGRVALGFDKIYATMKVIPVPAAVPTPAAAVEPELTGSFGDQLEQLALRRETERGVAHTFAAGRTRRERPTVVTGHSLGSALSTLFVLENSVKQKFDISLSSTLASPKVGNLEFMHIFDGLPLTSWRVVNIRDVVPKLPPTIPFILDYEHVAVAYPFDSALFAKKNLGCYHSIDTYLHCLNSSLPLATECV
jgi:hypothetical protein